jgi:NhaP-type Na+/H+ or K+/H+ antiporter
MNDSQLLFTGILWLGMMLPLLYFSSTKTNQGLIILMALLFTPLIGWLAYYLTPDKPKPDPQKEKFAKKLKSLHGVRSEDPVDAWERSQNNNNPPH